MIEFYKEKLTFYRLLLTLVATANSGCIAWVFAQYPNCGILKTAISIMAIIGLGILGFKLILSIRFCINKIKELK